MARTRTERVPLPRGPVAWHTATAEVLAASGRWQEAYQHLRAAIAAPEPSLDRRELDRLRREHAEAREQSRRDSLAAMYNRRYLDERLVRCSATPTRSGAAGVSLALDRRRSLQADQRQATATRWATSVLRCTLTACSTPRSPGARFCARYGGDEFAVVLPGSEQAAAVDVCEAARERIHRHPWDQLAAGLRVTVSVGVVHASGPVTCRSRSSSRPTRCSTRRRTWTQRGGVPRRPSGAVRLAGAAGGRRTVRPFAGVPTPACDRTGSAP